MSLYLLPSKEDSLNFVYCSSQTCIKRLPLEQKIVFLREVNS
jgi:hypothetical protein